MSFVLSYDELSSYVKQKSVSSVEETLSHPSGIDIKKNYLPRKKGIRNAIFIKPKASCPEIFPRRIGKAEKYPLWD